MHACAAFGALLAYSCKDLHSDRVVEHISHRQQQCDEHSVGGRYRKRDYDRFSEHSVGDRQRKDFDNTQRQ